MTMSRAFQGIWIPKEIWLNQSISMQAKCLWAEIHSLYSEEQDGCFASNDYLCEFMGLKLRRLQELLRELKDAGLLVQSSFNGRQRILKALVPAHEYKSECTADVQNNAPQGCRKVHPSRAGSCTPTYIENKEETKEENIARTHASHGREQGADMQFSHVTKKFEHIKQQDYEQWKLAYPHVDLRREIAKAEEWLKSNPSKARKKNWRKFLTTWLDRTNDRLENKKAYQSNSPGGGAVDRRTRNIDGTPVDSPVDGLF